jgi:hypothetical protein
MKFSHIFLKDGNLKKSVAILSSLLGISAALGVVFFIDDLSDWRPWFLAVVAIFFGYGSAWAGLMKKWGYRPFTNDPLGWRAAKASYEVDQSKNAETEKANEK